MSWDWPTTSDQPSLRSELPAPPRCDSYESWTRKSVRQIKAATTELCTDPRPHGAKALVGQHGWLRIRVGDYRMIYEVRDSDLTVLVIQIGHRSQVYEAIAPEMPAIRGAATAPRCPGHRGCR